MDFGPVFLPAETLVNIIRRLPKEDNKNVRLVSKGLNLIATPFLYESLIISTQVKDRENFTAIAEHPAFSQLVKEVLYDSTNMHYADGGEQFNPNQTSYTRFLFKRMNFTGPTNAKTGNFTKASMHRGFKIFEKNLYEQVELARYHGEDMTRLFAMRPDNFSSLLMDQKNHRDVAKYLPDDLVRLVHGLPRMPGVKRFVITDCRYAKDDNGVPGCLSVTINNEGVRGIDEVIINPRHWLNANEAARDDDINRSWYRGFFVLAQAASMTGMTRLKSFEVACITSGLSHTIFDMSPREIFHTANAFRNLTNIRLKIQASSSPMMRTTWQNTIARGGLAKVLGAAKHLEILDLRMEFVNPNPILFAELVGSHTWPNLRKFTLARVSLYLDQDGFLQFFERHRYTLRGLWLQDVMIVTQEEALAVWSEEARFLTEQIASQEYSGRWSHWDDILETMGRLAVGLTEMTFFERNFGPMPAGWVFHSCNQPAVFDFLRSRGVNRVLVPCQHCAMNFWLNEE